MPRIIKIEADFEIYLTKFTLVFWTAQIENPGLELAKIQAVEILGLDRELVDLNDMPNDATFYLQTMENTVSKKS